MKVIDFNVLYFRSGSLKMRLTEIMRELGKIGINTYVISMADLRKEEVPLEANIALLKECRGMRNVYLLATINPTNPKSSEAIKKLLSLGFCGIRLIPSLHGYRLDSDRLFQIAKWLNYEGLVDISLRITWKETPQVDFHSIADIAKEYEDLCIVISGINYTENPWLVKDIRRVSNILVEISLYQPLNGVKFLVEILGSERILFGTGYPMHYPHCSLFKVRYSNVSEKIKEAILYRNAIKVLERYRRVMK